MSPSLICTILRLLTHIGFVIDLDSGSFEVPLERWEILQQLITVALSRQKVLVHLLSRIAGHLSSMILAIGPIVLIKSRQCHSYLQQYSLHSTLPSLTARETNSPINPTCLVRIFAKKVGLPPLPLTFPYGVLLEPQVGVPQWRIKNCRHKVSSPPSCGMAHPVAHWDKCGDFFTVLNTFWTSLGTSPFRSSLTTPTWSELWARAVQTCAWMTLYSELSHSQWSMTFPCFPHGSHARDQNKIADGLTHLKTLVTGLWMLRYSKKSLHSGAYLPLTVLQATPIIYLTSSTLCCGAQVQSVSMRLLKETGQNILTGASHLATYFHRSHPLSGNSVQPLSFSYLSSI